MKGIERSSEGKILKFAVCLTYQFSLAEYLYFFYFADLLVSKHSQMVE